MGLTGVHRLRIADQELPEAQPDPMAAKGWSPEILVIGSYQQTAPRDGTITPVAVTGTVVIASKTVQVPSRMRTLLIGIPTAITFAAAQQITAQIISGRSQFAGNSGAGPFVPDTATETDVVGAAFNVGGAGTSLGPRWFWITPFNEIPQLQAPLEWIGVQITMPVGPTAGSIYAAFVAYPF